MTHPVRSLKKLPSSVVAYWSTPLNLRQVPHSMPTTSTKRPWWTSFCSRRIAPPNAPDGPWWTSFQQSSGCSRRLKLHCVQSLPSHFNNFSRVSLLVSLMIRFANVKLSQQINKNMIILLLVSFEVSLIIQTLCHTVPLQLAWAGYLILLHFPSHFFCFFVSF